MIACLDFATFHRMYSARIKANRSSGKAIRISDRDRLA